MILREVGTLVMLRVQLCLCRLCHCQLQVSCFVPLRKKGDVAQEKYLLMAKQVRDLREEIHLHDAVRDVGLYDYHMRSLGKVSPITAKRILSADTTVKAGNKINENRKLHQKPAGPLLLIEKKGRLARCTHSVW